MMIKKILKRILNISLIILIVATGLIYLNNQDIIQKANQDAIEQLQNQIDTIQEQQNNLLDNDIELLKEIQKNFRITEQIQKLQPKEVNITSLLKTNVFVQGLNGQGAGTVIKKTDKEMYILTCLHVVNDILEINKQGYKFGATIGYVKKDTKNIIAGMIIYGAEIIKYDEEIDLALLKTSVIDDYLEVAEIAKEEPQKGDIIYSIGSPLGLIHTISKGILANKEDGFFISDNTITYGNSGGGLYNIKGELIGVPSNVPIYQGGINRYGQDTYIPESGLGMSRDLQTINEFLKGVEF